MYNKVCSWGSNPWCEEAYNMGDMDYNSGPSTSKFNCEDEEKKYACIQYYDRLILKYGPYDCLGDDSVNTQTNNICRGSEIDAVEKDLRGGLKQWIPVNTNSDVWTDSWLFGVIEDYNYNGEGESPYGGVLTEKTAKHFIESNDINFKYYDEIVWAMHECCSTEPGAHPFKGKPNVDGSN